MTTVSALRPVRHRHILDRLRDSGAIEITTLSRQLGVSVATIRRDIDSLDQEGLLRRVHGGAVRRGSTEPVITDRRQPDGAGPDVLARHAAAMVGPGMTVAFSTGACAVAVARVVAEVDGIRILTHDLAVLHAVRGTNPDADVLVAGGITTRRGTFVGPAAVRAVGAQRIDLAVLAATGVDGRDVQAPDHWEAEIGAALLRAATHSLLVADRTAWDGRGLVTYATLSDFDHVVSDDIDVDRDLRTGPDAAASAAVRTSQDSHDGRRVGTRRPPSPPRLPARAARGKDDVQCPTRRTSP